MAPTKRHVVQRNKFSAEEDGKLRGLVSKYGPSDWGLIALYMPNRTARQCRERYKNYLAPALVNGQWTMEEDRLLEIKHNELGPKWATIAKFFPSRSEVNIKNRYSHLMNKRKRLMLSSQESIMYQQLLLKAFPPTPAPKAQQNTTVEMVEAKPVVTNADLSRAFDIDQLLDDCCSLNLELCSDF